MYAEVYVDIYFTLRFSSRKVHQSYSTNKCYHRYPYHGDRGTSLLGFQWLFLQEIGEYWPVHLPETNLFGDHFVPCSPQDSDLVGLTGDHLAENGW